MAEKVRCVIICGSPEFDTEYIKNFVNTETDYIICADSGYSTALAAGIKPDLFIGDFDSYVGTVENGVEVIKLNTHKDDTDSMHCAEVALKKGIKKISLLAATGARLDHTLANICVLEYLSDKGVEASIENRNETVKFLPEGEYIYNGYNNKTFSVIPFGCESAVVTYEGEVEYPAKSLELKSSIAVGISNIFRGDSVKIKVLSGNALVIVNI